MAYRTFRGIALAGSAVVAGTVANFDNAVPTAYASCGLGGVTALRPKPSDPDSANGPTAGSHYLDSQLGLCVVFDGATWRNPFTGAIA